MADVLDIENSEEFEVDEDGEREFKFVNYFIIMHFLLIIITTNFVSYII